MAAQWPYWQLIQYLMSTALKLNTVINFNLFSKLSIVRLPLKSSEFIFFENSYEFKRTKLANRESLNKEEQKTSWKIPLARNKHKLRWEKLQQKGNENCKNAKNFLLVVSFRFILYS